MGIVVCISMLLGLLMFTPKTWLSHKLLVKWQFIIAVQLFLFGVWNAAWYGIQHLSSFWGQAALVSGLIMTLVGIILAVESGDEKSKLITSFYQLIKSARVIVIVMLSASFALYAITLIQLNLGFPIIQ